MQTRQREAKATLRKHIRSLKHSYIKEQLCAFSDAICNSLLHDTAVAKAEVILAFYPLPDEVSIQRVLDDFVLNGKLVLLPEVVSDTKMILREYHSAEDLKQGAYSIMEPTGTLFTELERIDLALIPGMAFDTKGNRLGRGKGYYDRFLSAIHGSTGGTLPYLIGVCFPFQLVEKVPTDTFDFPVNKVVFQ